MSELTGGVLLAQTRKLDKIVGSVRTNASASMKASATCRASNYGACRTPKVNSEAECFSISDRKGVARNSSPR